MVVCIVDLDHSGQDGGDEVRPTLLGTPSFQLTARRDEGQNFFEVRREFTDLSLFNLMLLSVVQSLVKVTQSPELVVVTRFLLLALTG